MGGDTPPVPWREFERRLSWRNPGGRASSNRDDDGSGARDGDEADSGNPASGAEAHRLRPVTRLPDRRDWRDRPGRGDSPCQGSSPDQGSSPGQEDQPARLAEQTGPAWAELHCHSSYSFLDGASSPAELVAEALKLGLTALAITDHDGMYGVPQFAQAVTRVKEAGGAGLGTVFGAELSLDLPGGQGGIPDPAGRHLLVLARDPDGYRRLCRVISAAQGAGEEKGRPVYDIAELAGAHDGHWVILPGCRKGAAPAALTAGHAEAAPTAG